MLKSGSRTNEVKDDVSGRGFLVVNTTESSFEFSTTILTPLSIGLKERPFFSEI